MARAMKDSGIPWIGEIPEGWSVRKLKSLARIQTGNTPPKSDQETYYSDEGGYLWIKPENLGSANPIESTSEYLTKKGIDMARTFPPKTIYVCCIASIGNTGYCLEEAACNQQINGLVFYEDYYWKYGYYVTLSQKEEYILNSCGNVILIINTEKQKNLFLPYPPFNTQKRIASLLDAECTRIDAIIEKTRASIEEYKRLKQAVITEAVTKGIRPGREMKDSGIAWIGEIPEEWGTNKIKYISSEVGDGLHAAPEFSEDGDYYFINGNNLGEKQIKIKENTNSVSKTEYSKYNQPTLCANAILIALNGTYGLVSFYNHEKVMLGKSAGFINLFQIINRDYVRYALLSDYSKKQMDDSLAGTTIANVSLRTVRNLIITWPSNDEQIEISTYLDTKTKEFDDLLARKTEFISELESYKKSIIYEYVTGKKEVRCGK